MKEVGSLPLSEPDDRDADIAGSVGEVVLDPRARQDQDADLHAVQHLTVALDGPCLGEFGPVRLEGDRGTLRLVAQLAVMRPAPMDNLPFKSGEVHYNLIRPNRASGVGLTKELQDASSSVH